jgi:glioma pathogenesis-related protein 2
MRDPFPDRTDDAFLQGILEQVNNYRAKHGAPSVQLDPELVEYAKSRARTICTENGLSYGHQGLREGTGENLSWQASSGETPGTSAGAVNSWYSEIKNYDFANPSASNGKPTGHFTQVVWKGSTKVGAGRVFGRGAEWWETYIVLDFSPAGNMAGQYEANVAPAQT